VTKPHNRIAVLDQHLKNMTCEPDAIRLKGRRKTQTRLITYKQEEGKDWGGKENGEFRSALFGKKNPLYQKSKERMEKKD
jgi:hypothetical protein